MNWWSRRDASGGESLDHASHDAVRLAHRALERFPGVVARHRYVAGGAAISSALVVLAGVAIARRMRAGQSADEAIATLTEDEIEGRTSFRIEDDVAEALEQAGADAALPEETGEEPAAGLPADERGEAPPVGPGAESPR